MCRFHITERKLAHLGVSTLIVGLIPLVDLLPPLRLLFAGSEDQVRRIPVACHEALQIATIPGIDLSVQNIGNSQVSIGCRSGHGLLILRNQNSRLQR